MKKLFIFFCLVLVLNYNLLAQAPDSFNYQAVIRDTNGEILSNQNVELDVSILHATATGNVVYAETFNTSSNQFGIVNIKIGTGITVDDFSSIDWSFGKYFLKLSFNGNVIGNTQLLSIPYAKFADKAGNTFSGNYNDLTNIPEFLGWDTNVNDDFSGDFNDLINVPYPLEPLDTSRFVSISNPQFGDLAYFDGTKWRTLEMGADEQFLMVDSGEIKWKYLVVEESVKRVGEFYLDGIIFNVSPDGQHGLIASLYDLDDGEGMEWSEDIVTTGATSFYNGLSNTESIIAIQPSSVAQLCRNLGNEWYLPSASELQLLYTAAYEINNVLANDGDSNTYGIVIAYDGAQSRYWSSTETSNNKAWNFMFDYGNAANSNKNTNCRVRAIRAF